MTDAQKRLDSLRRAVEADREKAKQSRQDMIDRLLRLNESTQTHAPKRRRIADASTPKPAPAPSRTDGEKARRAMVERELSANTKRKEGV